VFASHKFPLDANSIGNRPMPIVVAQQVRRLYIFRTQVVGVGVYRFLVDSSELGEKYSHMCVEGTKVKAFVSRIFNQEFKVVNEPRLFSILDLVCAKKSLSESYKDYQQADGYYLEMGKLVNDLSIPEGYYVEILLISLVNDRSEGKTIFPFETRVHAVKELDARVNERLEALGKIGAISQSHTFLSSLGLEDISEELSQGYSRFEIGDYDGAIKSYRKVIEGFRNHLEQKETNEGKRVYKKLIDNSESRTEKLVDFLNKSYSLLSNFGEHYGTHAFDEEGVFSHKLVESLTEYLTKKLKTN